MNYAILCFSTEDLAETWSPEANQGVIARLDAIAGRFAQGGRVGMSGQLMPTTSAVSVRKGRSGAAVLDGPFIEAKEHLMGFYLVESPTLEAVVGLACELLEANPWGAGYEIRPFFRPLDVGPPN